MWNWRTRASTKFSCQGPGMTPKLLLDFNYNTCLYNQKSTFQMRNTNYRIHIIYVQFACNGSKNHHYFQFILSLLICAYTAHLDQISLPYPNLCMYTKMRHIFSSKFWDCICSCNITPHVLYVSLMFTQSKTILWEGKRGEFVDSGLFAFSFLCG